jgi:polyhydroxybutyrate depolymerase
MLSLNNKVVRVFLLLSCLLVLSSCTPRVTNTTHSTPVPQPTPTPVSTSGCGKTLPNVPLSSVQVAGLERSLITYIPPDYDATLSYPLIIAFHGRTSSNAEVREYFGLEAAMPQAIIVYPSGLWDGNGYSWTIQGDDPSTLRDFAFVDEILRLFQVYYCIEANNIAVVGHSLGAYFANHVACARANVISAVASVAGGLQVTHCDLPVGASKESGQELK